MTNIKQYDKKNWVNDQTPLNADNLNHIEDGISNNNVTLIQVNAELEGEKTTRANEDLAIANKVGIEKDSNNKYHITGLDADAALRRVMNIYGDKINELAKNYTLSQILTLIYGGYNDADTKIQKLLDEEVSERIDADKTLDNKITSEINRSKSKDSAHDTAIKNINDTIVNMEHFKGYYKTSDEILQIDADNGDYAYCADDGFKWVHNGTEWKVTTDKVPDKMVPKTTITPKMDGVAKVGNSNTYAAGDHVHPTDTSRASKSEFDEANNILNEHINDINDPHKNLIGTRNLVLNTGTPFTVPDCSTVTKIQQLSKVYQISDEIQDLKQFLLSFKDTNKSLILSFKSNFEKLWSDGDTASRRRVGVYWLINCTQLSTNVQKNLFLFHSYSGVKSIKDTIINGNSLYVFDSSAVSLDTADSNIGVFSHVLQPQKINDETLLQFYNNPDDFQFNSQVFKCEFNGFTTGGEISNIKLEVANIPSDWTPAPEDSDTKIDNHTNNKSNPHNVTASQVGTYDKETLDSKFDAVQEAIDNISIGDDVTVDLTNYYKKNETYNRQEIDQKVEKIISYGTEEPDDTITTQYYVKLDDTEVIIKNSEQGTVQLKYGSYTSEAEYYRDGNLVYVSGSMPDTGATLGTFNGIVELYFSDTTTKFYKPVINVNFRATSTFAYAAVYNTSGTITKQDLTAATLPDEGAFSFQFITNDEFYK